MDGKTAGNFGAHLNFSVAIIRGYKGVTKEIWMNVKVETGFLSYRF